MALNVRYHPSRFSEETIIFSSQAYVLNVGFDQVVFSARFTTFAAVHTPVFPALWFYSEILFSVLLNIFWLLLWTPEPTPHCSVLVFNHHTASGRLPSRKGSPLPGLPPNPSAACPSALPAAHSPVLPTTCRSTPCHSSLMCCGNIRPQCRSVPACVAKITLSGTLWVLMTSACDPATTATFWRLSFQYKCPWLA